MNNSQKQPIMNNSRGMSLIDVIMAISILGIVALGVMHLSKTTTDIQTKNYISVDYAGLAQEFLFLLTQEKHCDASLIGERIDLSSTDDTNPNRDPDKGVEVELWLGENASPGNPLSALNPGVRIAGAKRACSGNGSHTNACAGSLNRKGKINILGIKLSMPDITGAPPPSPFQAELTLYSDAIIGASSTSADGFDRKLLPPIKKNIIIDYDGSGNIRKCYPDPTHPDL